MIGTEAREIEEAEAIPIDVAIDNGWVRVADPLEYTNPVVLKTMDGIQANIPAKFRLTRVASLSIVHKNCNYPVSNNTAVCFHAPVFVGPSD